MDMEVDIPAAEELEWLESNALLEDPGEDEFEQLEGFTEGTLVEQPASPDRAMPGTITPIGSSSQLVQISCLHG